MLSLFVNVLALAVPVFVMQVYDRVIFHSGLNTLVGLLAGMATVLCFDFVIRQARARILQMGALRLDASIGRALFGRLVTLPLPFVEQHSAAYWHALFRDVDTVRNTLSGATVLMLCDVCCFALFLLVTFIIAPPVAWVLLAAVPVFAALARLSGLRMKQHSDRERTFLIERDALIAEIIAARTTVKALALEQQLQPQWEERHAAALAHSIRRGAIADHYATVATSLTTTVSIAITALGALAVLDQRLTIGALIAANMLSGRLLAPITQLGVNWRTLSGVSEAIMRLGRVFAVVPDREENGLAPAEPPGRLVIEDVSFSYGENNRPSLEHIHAAFPPQGDSPSGGMHALIGPNGSGKSTLLKLMLGLYYPSEGRVLLDRSDIAQYSRRQIAHWIGYLPQETSLFAGSIRQNIALRLPDASDDDIRLAAMRAGAHDFITQLPDGYATDVGECGRRLSAGQRQRIAIARAVLGAPPLLVLDEPSTSLDTDACAELRVSFSMLARTTTIVIVTHQLEWLLACQSVTVLERGRIGLSGPAGQVLSALRTDDADPRHTPSAPAERPTARPDASHGLRATGGRGGLTAEVVSTNLAAGTMSRPHAEFGR